MTCTYVNEKNNYMHGRSVLGLDFSFYLINIAYVYRNRTYILKNFEKIVASETYVQ